MVPNSRVTDEGRLFNDLDWSGRGLIQKILPYLPEVFKENNEKLSHESRCAGLDSNPAFPEYMFHTLTWSDICLQQKAYLHVTLVL